VEHVPAQSSAVFAPLPLVPVPRHDAVCAVDVDGRNKKRNPKSASHLCELMITTLEN